jgi:hypothetical protein
VVLKVPRVLGRFRFTISFIVIRRGGSNHTSALLAAFILVNFQSMAKQKLELAAPMFP